MKIKLNVIPWREKEKRNANVYWSGAKKKKNKTIGDFGTSTENGFPLPSESIGFRCISRWSIEGFAKNRTIPRGNCIFPPRSSNIAGTVLLFILGILKCIWIIDTGNKKNIYYNSLPFFLVVGDMKDRNSFVIMWRKNILL